MFDDLPEQFFEISYKSQAIYLRCCLKMFYGNNSVGATYSHALKILKLAASQSKRDLAPLIELNLIKKLDSGALMVNPTYACRLNSKKKANQIAWLQNNFDNGTFVPTVEPPEDQE